MNGGLPLYNGGHSEQIPNKRKSYNKRKKIKGLKPYSFKPFVGGDKRDRTADLLTASQALSQLSYTPKPDVPHSEQIIL